MRPARLLLGGTALALSGLLPRQAAHAQASVSDYAESAGPPPSAPDASVLPRSFLSGGDADLRDHLLDTFGGPSAEATHSGAGLAPGSGWVVQAQLGLSEEYTDNAGLAVGGLGGGLGGSAGPDFITEVSPAVTVQRETQRLTVNLAYAPIGLAYANDGSLSQVEQSGSGDVLAVLYPGWGYLDLRGSIGEQAVYGSVSPFETVAVAKSDRETNASVSVTPYLAHRFGTLGTAQLGIGYTYSDTAAPEANQFYGPAGFSPYGSGYLGTERAYGNFTTGEDLGRIQDRPGFDVSLYDGSGSLRGAHRDLFTDDASYALTRRFALLGELGYEDLDYPVAGVAYAGPIGYGGVRYAPRKDSTLVVEYRYQDGYGAAFAKGSFQVSPRIRLYGGYSEGITTFQQDQQSQLLAGTEDVGGVPDTAALAVPLPSGTSSFGGNQQVSLLRRLDINAVYMLSRDTVTASLQDERLSPLGRRLPAPYSQAPSSALFATLGWTHQLGPKWTFESSLQFGTSRLSVGGNASADTVAVSLGIDRKFTASLSGYARFQGTYSLSSYGGTAGSAGQQDQDAVVVGVLKRF